MPEADGIGKQAAHAAAHQPHVSDAEAEKIAQKARSVGAVGAVAARPFEMGRPSSSATRRGPRGA